MKIALVHDYIHEFGGAERVLLVLSEIWPEAPIYTAFFSKGSSAWKRFSDKDIRVSWFHYMPFVSKLASPLRFLAPLVWSYFNFTKYDVVITSANWYITKGIRKGSKAIEVCYCHTPPRYLYGYRTSINWQKYWPVRVYGLIVGHFLRMYDFRAAQRVDYFVANSKNVESRIEKFYRRKARVIYPPVYVSATAKTTTRQAGGKGYYLVVSRVVGGKGLELAVGAANKLKIPLKIVGEAAGWGSASKDLREMAEDSVEFLGDVSDSELYKLYAGAKAFLATAEDEDFGITPVEAMAAGTPVIAFKGGGYLESVVDSAKAKRHSGQGVTGVFFNEYSVESLVEAIKEFEVRSREYKEVEIRKHAERFSKKRFKREMREFVEACVGEKVK